MQIINIIENKANKKTNVLFKVLRIKTNNRQIIISIEKKTK